MSEDAAAVRDVASRLSQLSQLFARFKASAQNAIATDPDRVGNHLLWQIITSGPMRSGELAELNQADPSTVSRQVANLVRDGLLERRADPDDGRAILLHATSSGRRRHRAHEASRDEHYRDMLADWPAADRRTFADLLDRFIHSFDDYKAVLLADITDRSRSRPESPAMQPPGARAGAPRPSTPSTSSSHQRPTVSAERETA